MKKVGMVRKLDELGRITLPKEIRDTYAMGTREELEIYVKEGVICLRPVNQLCIICEKNTIDNPTEIKGKLICPDCRQALIEQGV